MKDEDLLKDIKEFKEASDSVWSDIKTKYTQDVKFSRKGQQWDDRDIQARRDSKRPILTFNKLPSFMRQVTNEARMNKPAIVVKPMDDKADVETARIINGIVRTIESQSNSDYAYDTAIDCTTAGGIGYIFVDTDYVDDLTFQQDIRLKRCVNPLTVYFDPMSTEPDGSDQMECFIEDRIRESQFKNLYPKADYKNIPDDGWSRSEGGILIGKYWRIDLTDDILMLMPNGDAILKSDLDANDDIALFYSNMGEIETNRSRTVKRRKVTQYVTNCHEILETIEWAGKYIPVVPVYGEEVWDGEEREYKSLHRDAQDAQRMYNYFRTSTTESVALQIRAPFIGKVGSFDTDSAKWATANTVNHAYIEYDGDVPPQRQGWVGVDTGSLQEALNASEDMKAIMGIYDASLGNRSNETSGVAIAQRKNQAGVSTYHFMDNLSRSIRQVGRIVVDLIPSIYDTPRMMRIIGEDGRKEEQVMINEETIYNGRAAMFDVTVGQYDVTVDTGPSFTNRREEVAAQVTETIRSYPAGAPLLMDILAENSDWPKADKVAKRFAAMLPPEIKQAEEQEEGDDPQVIQLTEQLQMAEQAIEQLKGMLSESEQKAQDNAAMIELEKQREINKGKLLDLQKQQQITDQKQAEALLSQINVPPVTDYLTS